MLQIVASITIVIYDCNSFIIQATDFYFSSKLFFRRQPGILAERNGHLKTGFNAIKTYFLCRRNKLERLSAEALGLRANRVGLRRSNVPVRYKAGVAYQRQTRQLI
jgi:hypothetical protein